METTILEAKQTNLNTIGLDKKHAKELAKKLNVLLANYSVFYQNVRGYHWNLKGENFFELHVKFEELYSHLYKKIDVIAERIATLGFIANHNFSVYHLESRIIEQTDVEGDISAAEDIVESLYKVIAIEREILSFATEMKDAGTYQLIGDVIKAEEKIAWMYRAYLAK
jgi:starvation-inducible DNA-binding protein